MIGSFLQRFSFLTDVPLVGSWIQAVWRRSLYYRYLSIWWRNARVHDGSAPINPFKLYWISPSRVKYDAISPGAKAFRFNTDTGRVRDGDWDRKRRDITDHSLWDGLHERYEQGIPWPETEYYQRKLQPIHEGKKSVGCYSEQELREKYEQIDRVYESMKADGYRSEREIVGARRAEALHEITVHVGRDGTLLRGGAGNHRIRLAHFLELDEIAVRIVVRHEQWQAKRDQIAAGEATPEDFGLDPEHPDLRGL